MRSLLLACSALTAVTLMSACSGGGGGTTTPTSPSMPVGSAPGSAVTITITRQNGAQSFSPNPSSAGGQAVVFKNNDTIMHHVTLNDGTVDTGDIAPGATSKTVTMPSAGANYHCSIHPDMVGAVSAASGAPPPPCEGAYCGGGY